MSIAQYINEKITGTGSKIDSLPFPTYRKVFSKNEIIGQFGETERRAYFLVDGIIESSIMKGGELRIIDFVFPNNFICSYTSFLSGEPSEIQTKAISDCEVEYFHKEDLETAYQTSIVANQFGRHVTERFLLSKLKRENDFLTKSAKERYTDLLEKWPDIIENIPVHKIAKYLGIHPESLSRIRTEVIS